MRPTHRVIMLLTLVAISGGLERAHAKDAETPEGWRELIDYVLPSDAEQGERAIPWRASLWDAVVAAHAERKPILLWAMNGHPLGCT